MKYVRYVVLATALGLVVLMAALSISGRAHAYAPATPFGDMAHFVWAQPQGAANPIPYRIIPAKVLRPASPQPAKVRRPVPIPAQFNPHGLY